MNTVSTAPRRLLAVAMAVGATALGTGSAFADTLEKPYVAPTGDVPYTMGGLSSCTAKAGTGGINEGQVCFTVSGLGGAVDLTIKDASPLPVGGSWAFYPASTVTGLDPDPRTAITSGVICGSAQGIPVPAGAVHLFVVIGVVNPDQAAATSHSTEIACGKPSPGTRGTVAANFSGGSATRADNAERTRSVDGMRVGRASASTASWSVAGVPSSVPTKQHLREL
jgi:hypothetical protein